MDSGTIVHVDYELYNADTGDLLETTLEEVAKEHEIHQEGRGYSPLVTVVGGGQLIEGFEDSLLEAEAETEYDIDIEPAKGYGDKDTTMIETINQDKLMRAVSDPQSLGIGSPVEIGGRTGILTLFAAGRARVDFNHPLAGRTLRYKYTIVKVVEDRAEKVVALLKSNSGHDDFEVDFDGDDVSVIVPQSMLFDTNAAMMKFRVVSVLREAMDVGKVSFVEVHEPRAAIEDADDHEHDCEDPDCEHETHAHGEEE
ncbi:MAG: FKBP-type peptidyl-prolyl cis-trans isomerase [Candidatus Poseidoniaceae archaeon]|nr:FKBP-type peptidyl-prolyl cis-trans isomerase [Candidatus Poseidoniaceae archaeon]MDP7203181.1 FKBP-type peptidyl-prolyl cis-trans isomerase [Candidatus Poseidoniaceae archaeon]